MQNIGACPEGSGGSRKRSFRVIGSLLNKRIYKLRCEMASDALFVGFCVSVIRYIVVLLIFVSWSFLGRYELSAWPPIAGFRRRNLQDGFIKVLNLSTQSSRLWTRAFEQRF